MAKQQFVSQFAVGTDVVDYFLIKSVQVRKTKTEKEYLSMVLVDKTGEVETRVWNIPAGLGASTLKESTFVKVRGSVSEYQDKLQLVATQIRVAEANEYSPDDFFRTSERDPEEMFEELISLLDEQLIMPGTPYEPTWVLLGNMLKDNRRAYCQAPAALSVHHCFRGGLLEHVLSLARLAIPLYEHYRLRRDLILAGCVLHDIGKIRELNYDCAIGYSTEGTLIGHISIGLQMISEACNAIEGFPQKLKVEILHMVASHHGSLSFGSPKVPMFREAIVFSLMDMMDSKLEICKEALRNDASTGDFTGFSKYLDTFLYKGVDA